jgi:23S rRNA (cytidine1920-2'-O)/16S rRNA (cytidine1409-2'-O)-methyltransferase
VRRRLDNELVRRGLAASRTEAADAVRAGLVTVGGRPTPKPATLVDAAEPIELAGPARPFVSRGGEKLAAALDRFEVDPSGLDCLDAGASTGGFTDCLLKRGASRVVAVDVGYGQLEWGLRQDPRVTVVERTNVRELDQEAFPFRPALVTADLSFISLRLAVPALASVATSDARFIFLVKPQFEAGREEVGRGGVVRDPVVWLRVMEDVAGACRAAGISPQGAMASPLLGPAGNVEFFLHGAGGAPETLLDLEAVVQEGRALREAS